MTGEEFSIRHWYIQKPIAHNCPLELNGAVFTEFKPTVSEQNCEWIRVYSADDIQKKVGMGLTRYSEVMAELERAHITLGEKTKELQLNKDWHQGTIELLRQRNIEVDELKAELANARDPSLQQVVKRLDDIFSEENESD